MKRLIISILTLCLFAVPFFADEPGDEYDDGYVYENNGNGDQFLKFSFSADIPLNFKVINNHSNELSNQLTVGAAFDLGYYRFFNKWFAVGGEFTFTSNWSIGEKLCVTIPITPGILLQPSVGNFEFPLFLNVGVGYESWANLKYFPSLAVKTTGGVYYRITEAWSAGLSGSFMWLPQWFKDHPEYNFNAMFSTITVGGRFHF